jgi:hypothetical protein
LLFDILRFFDHLDPTLAAVTLLDLGIDPATTTWTTSFMKDCTAWFSFNNFISEPFHPDTSMPQGSPLLPILSAIVTSPLLQKRLDFPCSDLTLYIDDGCIFASGSMFISTCKHVTDTFTLILDLLLQMNLEINVNKTELMFFTPPHLMPHHGQCPNSICIPITHGHPLIITPIPSI